MYIVSKEEGKRHELFLDFYFLLIRGAIERYFWTRMQDNMNFVRNVSLRPCLVEKNARVNFYRHLSVLEQKQPVPAARYFFGKSTFFKSAAPDPVKNLLFTATDHTGPEKY